MRKIELHYQQQLHEARWAAKQFGKELELHVQHTYKETMRESRDHIEVLDVALYSALYRQKYAMSSPLSSDAKKHTMRACKWHRH
jgi:hypothetical protein